ncbi:tRNA (adenosine(37)-N6)-dimethylallyltransferase MiaA [Sporolactobacillus terrae]|uniref:tRNA dimethylallyltransferase n=1 Tax=Sporolactobacillus terrae TaxID=269673 RepID=A0A410D8I9_9BACL|nr:tRNA (adenosine(37)-N6)-dimethylallyltransferase MiaA [Sporolactobacillus terrae]QAA22437.1 tRNA (adenosine(37)-N6)-dimethylallyltransferase MiaA [Sporolactobacillus terrae]QAA25411.1 tRNA (adenosine(37)-N6)-dimethylallyltransferase MiaA [Sporolactobacillus terrae]UAK17222.1 tRNA (adenosine(37)-N6)-dimethylallyltransferase MiaA [Sporolactobacillus terrae]BBN98755.1 tRNA dimethylallyltransferase [Sporolactobacillus terrae]
MNTATIVIVGPTAVGKTKLSIDLAKRLNSEIINGDAFQVYRGMDIGTAKVSKEEAEGVTHHLIDICKPEQPYTAAEYQQDARRIIENIRLKGKPPILVGGTGFYIKAALFDYQFSSTGANPAYRRQLEQIAACEGKGVLFERLKKVDPIAAKRIHPNNLIRVIRALEVYHETGKPFSLHKSDETVRPLYPYLCIGLSMNRQLLYRRINERVDQMIHEGLVDEAHDLYTRGLKDAQAMQAIGYKEFIPYFEGGTSCEASVEQLKKNSRHYAKRQLTWFRRQMSVDWFDMSDALVNFDAKSEEIYRFVLRKLDGHSDS